MEVAMNAERARGGLPERRWDIDWLRMLVVVGMLVPFHSFRLFDTRDPFYVKNAVPSTALNWYLIVGDTIGMQLLFMLAGAAAWYSLQRASAGQFAWQRVKRLLVPLLTGAVLVNPPQLYYAARFHGFSGSFFEWLPSYFTFDPEDLAALDGIGWSPVHLWFIMYLFVLSLVAVPVLLGLRTRVGRRVLGAAAAAGSVGAVLLVPAGLVLGLALLFDVEPNPLYYLVWFVAGYAMLAKPRLEAALRRVKGPMLLVGVVGLVLNILWQADAWAPLAGISELVGEGLRKTLVAWLVIGGLLGYVRTYLSEAPRSRLALALVAYLGEASYPFYILHHALIVTLGYFVLPAAANVTVKYVMIVALTYGLGLGIYEVAIRRLNGTRVLFGLRPRRGRAKEQPKVAFG
jgi:glucans biosynthesis protein C